MRKFLGLTSIPGKIIGGIRYFIWPRQARRRYRTAIFAVFLFSFLAFNFDYPKLWNSFADWYNPKLDGIDLPESVRRLDKWYILKKADDVFNVPHFADIPFSRGLDLEGGIHLIYEADLSQVESGNHEEAMGGLRDVIERRVNLFGVREPNVLVEKGGHGYRLVVELAGITDFNKAIELIGQTPYLEFKEERAPDDQKRILRKFFKKSSIKVETESGAEINVENQITDEQLGGYCATARPDLIAVVEQSEGEDPCFKSVAPPLTGKYLTSASLQFDPNTNQPVVSLGLDDTGAKIFEDVTGRNVGEPIAIYLDGVLINWPRVQEKISGGRAQITGFDIEGAKVLSRNLNAGALPVPITLISQQSIGASLGEESLDRSLRAGVIGIVAIIIFMILLYKLSGFLGVVALLIYLVFLLAIFKLLSVTLTLPGIAGLILSIGMAVDANILVFERLREELGGKGKGELRNVDSQEFLLALNRAFSRAWLAIRDGNVTTILTCIILFWFSTSFIKGFALTLGIGVAASMFSAMIVTRYLMRFVGEGRLGRKTWLWVR
ncbi:MAG: protein translocase subunit SecD [Candidatus Spechtbacterales bacterium]